VFGSVDIMSETPLRVGEWRVDPAAGEISRPGSVVSVEPQAMRLLRYLAQHPGQVIAEEELEDQLGCGDPQAAKPVARTVAQLRRSLNDNPREPQYIVTVPERGYRLVAPVEIFGESALEPPPGMLDASSVRCDPVSSGQTTLTRRPMSWKMRLAAGAVLILVGYVITRLAA